MLRAAFNFSEVGAYRNTPLLLLLLSHITFLLCQKPMRISILTIILPWQKHPPKSFFEEFVNLDNEEDRRNLQEELSG